MPPHFLTDQDKAIVQAVIDQVQKDRVNTPLRSQQERANQASDVYIAKVPEDGIPALTETSGTGTGDFDIPGSVACDIYHIIDDTVSGDPELVPIEGLSKTVYNLASVEIVEGWTLINKTKGGRWIADQTIGVARMCHGTLVADLSTGDSQMEIANVVTIFGPPVKNEDGEDFDTGTGTGTDTSLTVENVHSFSGSEGGRVTAVFCNEEEQWEAIQINC